MFDIEIGVYLRYAWLGLAPWRRVGSGISTWFASRFRYEPGGIIH